MKVQNNLIKQICSGAEDNQESIKKILKTTEAEFEKNYKSLIKEIKLNNFDLKVGNYKQRLADFRQELQKHKLDGFVLKTSDQYLNEYVSLDFYHLQYLSNFTGSLGLCIVMQHKAVLFVDGRYTLQAKQEVLEDCFEIVPYTLQDIKNWVLENSSKEAKIAVDSRVHSIQEVNLFKDIFAERLSIVDYNLVDNIWHNKAPEPVSEVIVHNLKLAHETVAEKQQLLLKQFANDYDFFLLTECDCISWLLNIRAKDVNFNPIVLSFLLLDNKGNMYLFINSNKLTEELKAYFALHKVIVYNNNAVLKDILSLTKTKKLALCNSSPYVFLNSLKDSVQITLVDNFCTLIKSKKSSKIIQSIRDCHVKDGVAVSKILMEVEQAVKSSKKLSEYEIAELCCSFRKEQDLFFSLSFSPIVGIDGNGAIVHYRPDKDTSKYTHEKCNILIDSGAHYLDGTTDITRSMSFAGNKEYNKHYTLVLKGLLALAGLRFPVNTTGDYIDIMARQFLFKNGLQYSHGTGHGVGYFLNVHEGPQRVAPLKNNVALEKGMVISNEPGVYFTNTYGIRLENLLVVKESSFKGFLEFEEITYAPFQVQNIVLSMLTQEEKEQLNTYHEKVYNLLSKATENKALLSFIKEKTKAV